MSKRRKEPTVAELDDSFSKFQLEQESDRACAVLGAAHLDFLLAKAIEQAMPKGADVAERLINDPKAPLATFSSKIDLAYGLGLINQETKRDLDTIREIRNNFAHAVQVHSFDEDNSIADKCRNFSRATTYAKQQREPHRRNLMRPRNLFVFTAIDIHDELRVLAGLDDKKPERVLMVKRTNSTDSQQAG